MEIFLSQYTIVRYLGQMLTFDLRDDVDIEWEKRTLLVRASILAQAHGAQEKITFFRAYCATFYTCSLWANNITTRVVGAAAIL